MFWTAVFTAGAALAAVLTALLTAWQARFTTRHQVMNQLDDRWNSDMLDIRRAAAIALRTNPATDKVDDILDFFETIALYARWRRVITTHLAWHYFYYWLVRYWCVAQPRVAVMRSKEPAAWEDLERFMPKIINLERRKHRRAARRRHPAAQIPDYLKPFIPDEKELKRFLQEESSEEAAENSDNPPTASPTATS